MSENERCNLSLSLLVFGIIMLIWLLSWMEKSLYYNAKDFMEVYKGVDNYTFQMWLNDLPVIPRVIAEFLSIFTGL